MGELDLSPVTRLEGHLDFTVDLSDGEVADAQSTSAMFRGFEQILSGRDPKDALVITPRICGVCPSSHNMASARTLDDAFNATVPPNGQRVRNLLLGTETMMSHAAHTYVLFGPDLTNEKYSDHDAYPELVARFEPLEGSSYKKAVKRRVDLTEIHGIFAGKRPHSTFVPAGAPVQPSIQDKAKASSLLSDVQTFLEETVLGCSVERWLANESVDDVLEWIDEDASHANSDVGVIIQYGPELGLTDIGEGPGHFIAYGAYPDSTGEKWLPGGFHDGTKVHPLDQEKIKEHVKYSWYSDYEGSKHPFDGITEPEYVEEDDAYTWAKCPRYDGKVAEAGPLARMMVDQDPLITDIADEFGVSVFSRVLARVHEIVRLAAKSHEWIDNIDLDAPFMGTFEEPDNTDAFGLTEAARGALGHWVQIRDGEIDKYQVVTPSAWNLSPRDYDDTPGPVEQAVIGTSVPNESNPVEVEHVIRSYDPCIACAVHYSTPDEEFKQEIEPVPAPTES